MKGCYTTAFAILSYGDHNGFGSLARKKISLHWCQILVVFVQIPRKPDQSF